MPASAIPLTFRYTGTVDLIQGFNSPPFAIGDTFTYTFTFNSETPDRDPHPSMGRYPGLIMNSMQVGSYSAYTGPPRFYYYYPITVGHDAFGTAVYMWYFTQSVDNLIGDAIEGLPLDEFIFRMDDDTGTAISSDALPLLPPDPALFNIKYMRLGFFDVSTQRGAYVDATINTAAMIPEPSTFLLILIALAMIITIPSNRVACRE
jgi:hypothetical protein